MKTYAQTVKLWQSFQIATVEQLDKYLDNFRILFAYHSGKIENDVITYHDTREIFENGKVLNYTGNPKALFEQYNQKVCYEWLKEKLVKQEPLTVQLTKDIHRVLAEGTYDERRYIVNEERPGEFKKHDCVTGIHEVGAPAEDVESELTELLSEINAYQGTEILKAAAYLHAKFEYIHPFADGNGRVGRTLLNYYLMVRKHPPLIIYDEDKKLYYECLQKYDETEDLDSLHQFLTYETEKTWKKTLEKASGDKASRKSLGDF